MVSAMVERSEPAPGELKPNLRAVVRVIVALLRPHLRVYVGILALSILEGILGALAIAALFPVFQSMAGVAGSGGRVLGWIQRFAGLLPLQPPIVAAGCLLIVLAFLKAVVVLSRETLTGYASAEIGYRLRNQMLARYVHEGYAFFANHRQGELVYNIYSGCLRVANLFNQLPLLWAQVINSLTLVVLLFSIHARATVFLVVCALALHSVATFVSTRITYPIGRAKKECMLNEQVIVNEFIVGFKQIFVFGRVPAWTHIHDAVNKRFKNLLTKEAALLASPRTAWEFLAFAGGGGAMMWLGARSPGGFSSEVVTLGVYLVALQRLLPFMSVLGRQWMALYGYLPDAFAAYSTLNAPSPPKPCGTTVAKQLERAVRFERVTFSYPDRGPLLADLDLTFERGKVTAIVGESGAGKTTVLNLILGLFQPVSGRIRIDDVDLRDIELGSWLAQIGFVSQDGFIFHGTVRENIAFFRTCSDDEIDEAARLANAHDFISEFTEGYATVVGDRGVRISGGQQQRLALARAIVKRPGIFVLDEATSSLDSVSENLIRDSLRKIAVNRTVIVVAHRLSTIVDADRIVVMKDGAVVETGTHSDLLRSGVHYQHLYGRGHESATASWK